MTEYVVDFGRSIEELTRFQLGMTALGQQMDKLEKGSNKSATAAGKLFTQMEREYKRLEEALAKSGVDVEKLGSTMERVRGETAKMMSGVAAANLRATTAAQAYNGELSEMLRLMQDTASKNAFVQSQQRIAQTNQNLINQNNELRAKIGARDSAEAKLNAALKQQLAYLQRLSTEQLRAQQAQATAERTLRSLNSEQAQDTEIVKAMINGRRQQITENTRLDYTLQQLERTMRGLNGGQQEQIALARAAVNAKQAEVTESIREDAQLKRLRSTLASLSGGRQEEIARVQAQIAARKRAIVESQTERKVVDELAKAIAREEQALVRLQAQAKLSSTSHGQRVTALRAEIAEQTRLNQLTSLSTAQLLGFSAAQSRVNLSQELGSQSAAMLRAGLTGLHASVGMYTSATVLAATATYGISAALRDSVITGAEFQATMSRTEAIMSSVPSWMTDTSKANKAMEMQVRALGQTTVFTASEVGEGLQQLGMAGFATNDAMTALPATLTLANLANVSMARSADIATNVLMTFNMQAKDLTGVVDLMATAVNNSNTDIEQLANALSYAGPAAQTAGISLKDTVAAVEALANSGIKGSRAGSALRRLFVSLLNPTKKGAEVIRQYGLDIVDAEGKTRSLTNIIGQLSNALKGVPGPERLAAIQDLVGVYATSPIAALVDQADNFQKFRDQNENTAGAGERMEKIISDNLKFDWKEMLSALEEVQLQAFDSMGMRLREIVAGLTVSVLDLMEPVKTIGNVDITGLDRLMVQAQTAAESLAYLAGGVVAYKFASGNMFRAFAADAKGAGERLGVLSQRLGETAGAMRTTAYSTVYASNAMQVQNRTAILTAGGLSTLSASAGVASKALSTLATYGGMAMRALGWVGLVYGIGSAIYELFSTNTDEKVLEHKASIDEVKSSYEQLKEQIEATGVARQRAAAVENVKAQQGSVTQLQNAIAAARQNIAKGEELGAPKEAMDTFRNQLASLEKQLPTYEQNVKDAQKTLDDLGTTTVDVNSAYDEHAKLLVELETLTNNLATAQKNLAATSRTGINNLNGQTAVSAIQAQISATRARMGQSAAAVQDTQRNIPTVASQFDKFNQEAQASAEEAAYKKTATVSQKLLDLDVRRNQELTLRQSLIAQDVSARAANLPDLSPGAQIIEASNKRLLALDKEKLELQDKQKDQLEQLRLAREASSAAERTEAENQVAYKKRLVDIDAQIKAAENPEQGKAVDLERVTALYREQTSVRQQLASIEKKEGRASSSGIRADVRELEQAQRAYDALAKKFDAVTYAQRELTKGTEAMNLLRKAGKITAEQEAKAVGELNQKYYEAVQAQDLLLAALNKVRASRNSNPFGSAVSDLATLNRALDEGKIKLDEYTRLTSRITKERAESIKNSLPKADLAVGEASSSPFTDWVNTEITRAQGLKDFGKAMETARNGEQDQMAVLNEQFQQRLALLQSQKLIEQGQEQAHTQKMLEINQQYAAEKQALMTRAGDEQALIAQKQAEYAQQMSTMAVMAAMGSVSNVLGMFASAASDATAAQKAAFIAQKAITVAQIIMYTELAAAQALAVSGNPILGLPLSTFIRATGYANAGLVAALAIGDLATGGNTSTGSTQMYDTGGYIPYNRTGIVGEYGPELVTGPAHVRGRGATSQTTGGGSVDQSITLAPVIQVTVPPSQTGGDSKAEATAIANATTLIVMKQLKESVRPGGFLDTWLRNSRSK